MTDDLETNSVFFSVKLREPELNWSWNVASGNPGQINVSERIKGQVCPFSTAENHCLILPSNSEG